MKPYGAPHATIPLYVNMPGIEECVLFYECVLLFDSSCNTAALYGNIRSILSPFFPPPKFYIDCTNASIVSLFLFRGINFIIQRWCHCTFTLIIRIHFIRVLGTIDLYGFTLQEFTIHMNQGMFKIPATKE